MAMPTVTVLEKLTGAQSELIFDTLQYLELAFGDIGDVPMQAVALALLTHCRSKELPRGYLREIVNVTIAHLRNRCENITDEGAAGMAEDIHACLRLTTIK